MVHSNLGAACEIQPNEGDNAIDPNYKPGDTPLSESNNDEFYASSSESNGGGELKYYKRSCSNQQCKEGNVGYQKHGVRTH